MRRVGTLLIVSDPTARGIETAALIKSMVAGESILECGRLGLVFNKQQGNTGLLEQAAEKVGLEIFGFLPLDDAIAQYDFLGKPMSALPRDALSYSAVKDIVERYFV
jgi:CO dehydrogenase maturation factor